MPFKKGQSGNPGGRKKKTPEVIEVEALAQQHTPEAIARLAHWIRKGDGSVSVKACSVMLERGHGRPKQTTDLTIKDERMVVEAPRPAKDADEWASTHRPH